MTQKKQEDAFERELHALCTHFFDEWDIDPWSMIEILDDEKVFLMSLIDSQQEEEEEEGNCWEDDE